MNTQQIILNGNEELVNPMYMYLFILMLELFFILIKSNKDVCDLTIIDHQYLKMLTTHILKTKNINTILKYLSLFSKLSGLCVNITRCDFPGISIDVVHSGIKRYNLGNKCFKILAVYIPSNKKA